MVKRARGSRVRRAFPKTANHLVLPEPQVPLYNLAALEDPPDDWEFIGFTLERLVANRTFQAGVAAVLAKFHLWGIKYKTGPKAWTKKKNCEALWKYFYHMQEWHRPSVWSDLFDLERDSGPRLLRWTLDPRPLPVSQRYPEIPPTTSETMEQIETYGRPADAPDDVPDSYIVQMMYSAAPLDSDDGSPPWTKSPSGNNTTRSRPGKRRADSFDYATDEQPQKKRRVGEYQSPSSHGPPRTTSDPTSSSESPLGPYATPPETTFWVEGSAPFQIPSPPIDLPSGISPPREHVPPGPGSSLASSDPSNSSMGPPPDEPTFTPDPLKVEVEKLLMKHAYGDLQRHPEAPHPGPIPNQIASDASHLAVVQSGAFSSIRAVRLNLDNLELSSEGYEFPYRGRGPVGSSQSCFIDCVIMLGKLLDAGCTVADRKESRSDRFNDIENAFIEITNMNWDAFDEKVSNELRNAFHRLLCSTYPQLTIGHLCPPWSAWSVCTQHFEQFRYYYTTEKTRCICKGGTIKTSEKHGCFIGNYLTDGDASGVNVSTLVERSWPACKPYTCKDCGAGELNGGPTISKKITRLPLRLVVLPILGTKVINHTDLLEFLYLDGDGKSCKATYRWLGGIYFHGEHARVWWTDAERGEMDLGDIRMYDGTQVSGTMFGGIPASDINERVDPAWVNDGGCPPMLVYEQVLNPSIDMLFTAMDTVNTMGQMVQQERQVLVDHIPWVPPPKPPLQRYLWRHLPSFGDIFINSKRPDPFDTLPADVAFIDVRDWVALRHINEHDPRLAPFKEQMAIIPSDYGDPPSPPPGTQFFDTLLKSPFGFVDQPEMWSQGPPDAAGMMYFPELPPSPDARPMSTGSQASGATRFTFADWLETISSSSRGSSGSKKRRSTDVSMRDAWSSPNRSPRSNKDDRDCAVRVVSHACRGPSEPKLIRIPPDGSSKGLTRAMRKQVLIRNTNRKRARLEDNSKEHRHSKRRKA